LNIAEVAESTAINLLTESKLISTAQGQVVSGYYSTLIADIKNWKSGTPANDIEQIVQDIEAILPALPIPAPFNVLVPIALGGLTTILTLLGANSPAPTPDESTVPAEAHQLAHAHTVGAAGEAKVEALTGYKPSMIDKARAMLGDSSIAANKYKQVWNDTVDANGLPETLKAA
jgi:hypothetical protein